MRVRLLPILALLFCHFLASSQSTTLRSVTGTGIPGYTGDGSASISANIDSPTCIIFDRHGNMYFSDPGKNVVRRVSSTGIITTIAGTGTPGFSGDGGPAAAAMMYRPLHIAVDTFDNIYIADHNNNLIRKVDATGIITTVAGNGASATTGDGGPATAAAVGKPSCVAVDPTGNLYIASDYGNVRKINTAGIITTFAGGGSGGDGSPATAASVSYPTSLLVSNNGDILISESNRVRSVNAAGIISTIAGNATWGFSGDNGPATNARFSGITHMHMDIAGNLYIADAGNYRVRKIDAYTSKVVTIAGNNGSAAVGGFAISTQITAVGITSDTNGTIYIGNAAAHRIQKLDRLTSISFYLDANNNCAFDAAEYLVKLPSVVAVDSNGITIDTLCATGGIDYLPRGNVGDIYAYRIVSPPLGLMPTCPTSGVVYDTIHSANTHFFTAQIGFECTSSLFDLSINSVGSFARPWEQHGHIYIGNNSCAPEDATVTATFSNNFTTSAASMFFPTPSAITTNSVSWHFPGMGAMNPYWPHMYYNINNNPSLPMPAMGDAYTVQVTVTPSTGDSNPINNQMIIIDTIHGSHDPNDITSSPAGCIAQGTRLEYTIRFENTGSDTAFNIFVMDTLPASLEPKSMRILHASHAMNVARLYLGDRTILKFDFPNINLPDTSHHGLANGTFRYTIMPRYPLPAGTEIKNRVGIYFDYNPVVLTNTAWNMIDCPTAVTNFSSSKVHLQLTPNPTEGKITVKYSGIYDVMTITDITGRQVTQVHAQPQETIVDVTALPAGLYYVALKGQAGIATAKFCKL